MGPVNKPLVSIITPTYNHELFIRCCLDSSLAQSYPEWEQIVIDDGSTDDTSRIISGYSDSRIRYYRQAHQGPFGLAKTYNYALSLARGDLIAILEGDDYWPADKLASLIPVFQDRDIVLAHGEREEVDPKGRRQRGRTDTERRRERLSPSVLTNTPVGAASRYMLLQEGRSLVHPCTVVLRRSALERIGGFQEVPGLPLTDYPSFIELSLIGRFFYTPRTMGYLRRHERSITACHARAIHDAVSSFAREFSKRHADTLHMSPEEWSVIENNWQDGVDRLHFSEARKLLLQKRWSDAREHFLQASKSRCTKVWAASLTGWLMSLVHRDIEIIMRLGGRADLRVND